MYSEVTPQFQTVTVALQTTSSLPRGPGERANEVSSAILSHTIVFVLFMVKIGAEGQGSWEQWVATFYVSQLRASLAFLSTNQRALRWNCCTSSIESAKCECRVAGAQTTEVHASHWDLNQHFNCVVGRYLTKTLVLPLWNHSTSHGNSPGIISTAARLLSLGERSKGLF